MTLTSIFPRWLAGSLLLALVTIGCSNRSVDEATVEASTTSMVTAGGQNANEAAEATSNPAETPALVWADCGDGLQCAELAVPLDHFKPDVVGPTGQRTWTLALARRPATADPVGSIVVNPGGPGASGVEFMRSGFSLGPEVAERYHLVGFDPRGIGASGSIPCRIDRASGPLPDYSPDNSGELDALNAQVRQLANQCLANGAGLLETLASEQVVEDLDLLRQAMGDDVLNFVGLSYGTYLGASYARAYPESTGHLILDGVVSPTATLTDLLVQQSKAFQQAADRFDAACGRGEIPECPDTGFSDGYRRLMAQLERSPMDQVGPTELTMATLFALYTDELWATYAKALADGLADNEQTLERLSDAFLSSVDFVPYAAYVCNDLAHPSSPEAWDELATQADRASPLFGAAIANELRVCGHWSSGLDPGDATQTTDRSDDNNWLSVPALIVGTTGDTATPIANSRDLHAKMPNSALVTVVGERHTSLGSSACLDDAVTRWLVDSVAPPPETECSR